MRFYFLNPFWMMASGLALSMMLYQLGLSGLYLVPFNEIDVSLILVMAVCVVSGGIALSFLYSRLQQKPQGTVSNANLYFLIGGVWLGFAAELFYEGGIPLVMSLSGGGYDYSQFGIPTFHVFFLSYCSAFAVASFDRFMQGCGWKNLLPVFSALVIELLIVNRGAMLITFGACILLYLFSCKHLVRSFFCALIAVLGMIVAFGYVGDKRMKSSGYSEDGAIYKIGQADELFNDPLLPSGFFWSYLYASSPYANLVKQAAVGNESKGSISDFLSVAVVPDFISKYYYSLNDVHLELITPELNVATGFGRAFVTYGYVGVLFLFVWYCCFVTSFIAFNGRFLLRPVVAILCVMSLMMIFENMLIFASFVVQIILLTLVGRVRFNEFRFI